MTFKSLKGISLIHGADHPHTRNSPAHAVEVLFSDFMQVQPQERVVITADTASDPALLALLLEGAQCRGRHASAVLIPRLPAQGALADPFIPQACWRAVQEADVWIDITFPYMAGSGPHDKVMEKKSCRYLLLGDVDVAAFTRLFGDPDLDAYFATQREFDAVFAKAGATCRITCPQGSDFSFQLAKPIFEKPRRAAKPGMYTIPGACSIGADGATLKGRIVLGAVFHHVYEVLHRPIAVEVDGTIQKIDGTGAAAASFRQAVQQASPQGKGRIIHLTNGMHPTARFVGRSFNEDMRSLGNNAVGFGLPWWEPGGGENHPDGVIVGQSVSIDREPIVRDGIVVGGSEELLRAVETMLAPVARHEPRAARAEQVTSGSD